MLYKDSISGETHVVFKKGRISKSKPVLVRVQQTNVMHDLLRVDEYGARWSLGDAMKKVNKEGSGLIIVIDGGKTNDEVIQEVEALKDPYKKSSTGIDVRRIGAGSQILRDLGVKKIKLMGSQTRYPSISGFGLEVTKYIQK
jgi:3,4-dihydroxy 2-butanone 4-phosphate synthase/GTP cyclohydrolase II